MSKRTVFAPAVLLALCAALLDAGGASAQADSSYFAAADTCCPVLELRQYTMKPGRRGDLIRLFDREFVESQEAVGMRIVGQFRNLQDQDQFVWLRGFESMESRRSALRAFYGGPVWARHRKAANDTMIDASNVLLLRPLRPSTVLDLSGEKRPARGTGRSDRGTLLIGIYHLAAIDRADRVGGVYDLEIAPLLLALGLQPRGVFVSETAENTFPQLPVREGEPVLVWVASIPVGRAPHEIVDQLKSVVDAGDAKNRLTAAGVARIERLQLAPSPRSALSGGRSR